MRYTVTVPHWRGGAVKTSIYLPEDLAEEVKRYGISVSAVTQEALRKEVAKMQAKEAITSDLEKVAARLRATQEEEDQGELAEGRDDGRTWARLYATKRELTEIVGDFVPGDGGDFGSDHSLAHFMGVKDGQNVISVRHQDDPYWRGFVAGATEVWEAV